MENNVVVTPDCGRGMLEPIESITEGGSLNPIVPCESQHSSLEEKHEIKHGDPGSANPTTETSSSQIKEPVSRSSSFPPKGILKKKSVEGKKMTKDVNDLGAIAAASSASNGSLISTSRSNNRAPQGYLNSKQPSGKRSISKVEGKMGLGSILTTGHSQSGKSASIPTTANCSAASSKVLKPQDQNQKQPKHDLAATEEDAHSSTSPRGSSLRRNSGTAFASRCNERAEKRKEFFSKLEEKIHAKEMEKTNMQAKSKESQEAEIKQLRKSLMFKAMPMPSFYQEPGPPKVDLKKIPTTRPISPKLGRHKSSAAVDAALGNGLSTNSTRPNLEDSKVSDTKPSNNKDALVSKKPIRRSFARLPSKKAAANSEKKLQDPQSITVEQVLPGEEAEANESSVVLSSDAGIKIDLLGSDPVHNSEFSLVQKLPESEAHAIEASA